MNQNKNPRSIPLQCCDGKPAPPEVFDGWNRLTRFPAEALLEWWTILDPVLSRLASLQEGQRIVSFLEKHNIGAPDLLAALNACKHLITHAVAFDLKPDAFKKDLEAISGGRLKAAKTVLDRYGEVRPMLRSAIIKDTLLDHGKVLTGINWRNDKVSASSHGLNLAAPVLLLTFHYRYGDESDRLTLQLTPKSIQALKEFVQRFGW